VADRCLVEVLVQRSVLVDLLPDDLALADCSESAPVGWADYLARLRVADRCLVEVLAQRSASADLLPADY